MSVATQRPTSLISVSHLHKEIKCILLIKRKKINNRMSTISYMKQIEEAADFAV